MKTRLITYLFSIVVSVFLFGCTVEDADRLTADFVTIPDQAAAEATQKRLLSQPKFNLSKVMVARMEIDGHPVEVTSLLPASFRGYKAVARGFKHDDGRSFTLILFDQGGDRLILFTRDREKRQAYKLLVPVAAIEAEKHYRFPFTDKSAKVKQVEIQFKEIKSR